MVEVIKTVLRTVLISWWVIPLAWPVVWMLFGAKEANEFATGIWLGEP